METKKRGNPIMARIKKEQIAMEKEIILLKSVRKNYQNGNVPELYKTSQNFRHRHIAYCEIRGRKREDIEVCSQFHKPNEKAIKEIKTAWLEELRVYNETKENAMEAAA